MPAIRTLQSLRERCNVQLNVKTEIPHNVYDDYILTATLTSPAGGLGRRRRERARRRPSKRSVLAPKSTTTTRPKDDSTIPYLHPMDTPVSRIKVGLPELHPLVPGMYLSFTKDKFLPAKMVSSHGSLFTHVVKIIHHRSGVDHVGDVDIKVDERRGLCLLGLVVPAPDDECYGDEDEDEEYERTETVLTENQLLAARDFLALALPYFAEAHPPAEEALASARTPPDDARVLIAAPYAWGAAADIMSIALCYLSWASEEPVNKVLKCIRKEEEYVPPLWRDAVWGKEALTFIQQVALTVS
ncbi:hypothetical protein H0H92_012465 [Tricholoma furcatifolium]|nr:hypothetical protein H0H92_012465 [Tricholoma furcatifolium]